MAECVGRVGPIGKKFETLRRKRAAWDQREPTSQWELTRKTAMIRNGPTSPQSRFPTVAPEAAGSIPSPTPISTLHIQVVKVVATSPVSPPAIQFVKTPLALHRKGRNLLRTQTP